MSALLQEGTSASRRGEALERLNAYIEELRQRSKPIGSLEEFEREAHELVAQVERELVAEGLSRFDRYRPERKLPGGIRTR